MASPAFLPDRRRWLAALLLVGLTIVAYLPALRGGFVWDDDASVTQNAFIRNPNGLFPIWFTAKTPDYWPVTSSVFWVEWRLWGEHALGYHAINLSLHIVESLLLWSILRRMRIPGSYLAALLCALHPVNVESVAWIAELKNLTAMLFFLLSILCFLKTGFSNEAGKWGWLSLAAFLLAVLSKGSAVILPIVLLGIIAWNRRIAWRDVIRLAPYFVVAGVLTLVNIEFQAHQLGATETVRHAGGLERLLGAGAVVWFYLTKALLPLNLAFIYPQWRIAADNVLWWLPLLGVIAVTGMLWRLARRDLPPGASRGLARGALFAWGYFCVALLPVMGFTDVYFMRYSLVADHYAHFAIIGVVSLAAAAWSGQEKRTEDGSGRQNLNRIAMAAVVCTLGVLTWRQCRMYADSETLYRTIIARNPNAWMAYNNLGVVLAADGRSSDAIGQYEQALRLDPDDAEAHYNLAIELAKLPGRLSDAVAHYEQTLRIDPDYADAHINLGVIFAATDRSADAIEQYSEALRARPDSAEAHNDLGIELAKSSDRLPEAIEHYEQALRINPDYVEARNNLAVALAQTPGRLPEAIGQLEQVLKLDPGNPGARHNLEKMQAALKP
jgi:tetratricopeptide (TPR) repeat protein